MITATIGYITGCGIKRQLIEPAMQHHNGNVVIVAPKIMHNTWTDAVPTARIISGTEFLRDEMDDALYIIDFDSLAAFGVTADRIRTKCILAKQIVWILRAGIVL